MSQNVSFNITSNSSPSYITISKVLDDWTFRLSASKKSIFNETLRVTAYDLNMSNESMVLTNVSSNYFNVKILKPNIVQVPVPQPSSGGGGATIPVSLKIISPGKISIYNDEKIIVPIQLINTGKKSFDDLSLNVSAFKEGNITNEIRTSLDKDYFKTLKPGQEENLTLEVFFDEEGAGAYEILVTAKSKSPNYKDSEKIYLNPINDSNVEEVIIFTEEFLASNPQCIEISEVMKEARSYFDKGDYVNAKAKTEQALNSCRDAISQVSVPKIKIPYFTVSLYLVIAVITALIIGLIYYFIKRRRFQKSILNKSVKQEKL